MTEMVIDLSTTKLRDHQINGVKFLLDRNLRTILADKAGLGKSIVALEAIHKYNTFPVLIAVNKPGLAVWSNELNKWYNEQSCVYTGTPKQREKLLQDFITNKEVNFIITTFPLYKEILTKLTPAFFRTLIIDEYHLAGLLNRKTAFSKFTKSIAKSIPHILLLSGTPSRRGPHDWYCPLSITAPNDFGSFWDFVGEYCVTIRDRFGITIEPIPQNEYNFSQMLDKYRRRYTDKSHLPSMTRQPLPIEMTSKQKKLFDELRQEMVLEEDGQFVITPNKLARELRCRQLMVTPRLLGFEEDGSMLENLKALVEEELSEENPLVIFTPFRKAIQYIREKIEKIKLKPDIYIVHGGMAYSQHKEIQAKFQNPNTKNKVLICVIKSGTTMTLTEANVAIFLGYEYSLGDNTQAEDRLFRETQDNKVRAYYFLYRGNPVDERAIEILNGKVMGTSFDISRDEYYKTIVEEKCSK